VGEGGSSGKRSGGRCFTEVQALPERDFDANAVACANCAFQAMPGQPDAWLAFGFDRDFIIMAELGLPAAFND
jgi:hypothetical protein